MSEPKASGPRRAEESSLSSLTPGPTMPPRDTSRFPPATPGFRAEIPVRWSDMDAFQHVNHARMVTLLEEARIPWLLAEDRPTVGLGSGAVVTAMDVRYREQVRHGDGPLAVRMWVRHLRAADVTTYYEVRRADAPETTPSLVRATVGLAAFSMTEQHVRRFTPDERAYFEEFWL